MVILYVCHIIELISLRDFYTITNLPDLGSNQDYSVPETDVLPITPSGISNNIEILQKLYIFINVVVKVKKDMIVFYKIKKNKERK